MSTAKTTLLVLATIVATVVGTVRGSVQATTSTPGHSSTVAIKYDRIPGKKPIWGVGVLIGGRVLTTKHSVDASYRITVVDRAGVEVECSEVTVSDLGDIAVLTCGEQISADMVELSEFVPCARDPVTVLRATERFTSFPSQVVEISTRLREGRQLTIACMSRQGDCGSPIFDRNGKLVSIVTGGETIDGARYTIGPATDVVHDLLSSANNGDRYAWPLQEKVRLGIAKFTELIAEWETPDSRRLAALVENQDADTCWQARYLLTSSLVAEGKLEEARRAAKVWVETGVRRDLACFMTAAVCFLQGEFVAAVAASEESIKVRDSVDAREVLAAALMNMREHESAPRVLAVALAIDQDDPRPFTQMAQAEVLMGRAPDQAMYGAVQRTSRSSYLDPLCTMLARVASDATCENVLLHIAEDEPQWYFFHLRAKLEARRARWAASLTDGLVAYTMHPTRTTSIELARAMSKCEMYAEAIGIIESHRDVNALDEDSLNLLALSLWYSGNHARARDAIAELEARGLRLSEELSSIVRSW